MLDINALRNDLAGVAARLALRGVTLDTARFDALEAERKHIQTRTQELQAKRNTLSREVGIAKAKGEDAAPLLAEVAGVGDALKNLERELDDVQVRLRAFLLELPNVTHETTPVGRSADDNVEVRRHGVPRAFDFPVRDHTDLGEALGMLDFATAAKLSGARFTFLRGDLARLHRALAQLMLDTHTREHGYTECYTPYVVNAPVITGREILALGGLLPPEDYTLRVKSAGSKPEKVGLDEKVDLRKPGVEKFKALPRDQTEG